MAGKKSRNSKGKEDPTSPPTTPRSKKGATSKRNFNGTTDHFTQPQATFAVTPVPVNQSLLKRFYEALVMLAVLGKHRGDPLDEAENFNTEPETSDLEADKLRRSFLRNLAYLCDYDAGGDRTTAIALQETPQGPKYWMASNKCPDPEKDRQKDFVTSTLQSLSNLQPEEAEEVHSLLFSKSVAFSVKRISRYAQVLEQSIDFVLGSLSKTKLSDDLILSTWLQELKDHIPSPIRLCRKCYEVRESSEFASLRPRATSGSPLADYFDKIRHSIGRLNHTMKAVKSLIYTRLSLPRLFDGFEVVRAKSPSASPPPLRERNPTLHAIAGRLSNDPAVIQECRQGLEHLDRLHKLSEQLRSLCTNEKWRPRVHAELILLDLFWTDNFKFVAGDKYIACSKPACYCCYHYIQEHPGIFRPPKGHNNNWLNWRPPDIYDALNARLIKTREDILNKMAKKIRIDVLAQIAERRGPGKWRADSFTEITTVLQEDFAFLADVPEGSSSESISGNDFSETSDVEDVAGEMQFFHSARVEESDVEDVAGEMQFGHSARVESETEDDEAGGVQLFPAPTV